MKLLFQLKHFLLYQWHGRTKYYIHSPFVYQFYLNVLEGNIDKELAPVIQLREQLNQDNTSIYISDFGTGKSKSITVSNIAKQVSIKHKYGQLLYRLVRYYNPASIIELGTSIGLSSSYLSLGVPSTSITTLEGSNEVAAIARRTHQQLSLQNINVIEGNFENTIPALLQDVGQVGLVFFDGNHTQEATLQYFHWFLSKANEESIFVFDDIYWSEGMYAAWQQIKQHPQVTLTIDVYQFGICFFKKGKTKEDFVLRY